MTDRPHKYLIAVQKACELLMQFVHDKKLDDFKGDAALRWAVDRQCRIIGEGLHHALNVDPGLSDVLTDVDEVVCLRRVLRHGDLDIGDEAVWEILGKNLPALHAEVSAFLTDSGREQPTPD